MYTATARAASGSVFHQGWFLPADHSRKRRVSTDEGLKVNPDVRISPIMPIYTMQFPRSIPLDDITLKERLAELDECLISDAGDLSRLQRQACSRNHSRR
jgi:hypothetical protein